MAELFEEREGRPRFFTSEMILLVLAFVSGFAIVFLAIMGNSDFRRQVVAGIVFTLSLAGFIRLLFDPDSVRARQSDELLKLASMTLECTKNGLTGKAAQDMCDLLLPATAASAVAITDKGRVLGYSGYSSTGNRRNSPICTPATFLTLSDGKGRILLNREEIGLPDSTRINAAIIRPLNIGPTIEGTLIFYYRHSRNISQTQRSMAEGFSELISTQMAASALEEQTRLATSLELKALQAQINPHFLFNTINTIASLIRTDPTTARTLLREFAVFYRHTLENASDLIDLDREVDQVKRYLMFEVARFGEDRLQLHVDVSPEMGKAMVPSFMIQPLVENAVQHALPPEGKLNIWVKARVEGDYMVIDVIDDGAGMSEKTMNTLMHPSTEEHLGIAVKNVRDRMRAYFGQDARMDITSKLGEGTTVSFVLRKNPIDRAQLARGLEGSDKQASSAAFEVEAHTTIDHAK